MLRRIRGSERLRRLAGRLAALYLRFVHATCRWTIEGEAVRAPLREGRMAAILLVWHGRVPLLPTESTPATRIRAMISANRDGDVIAEAVGAFGVPAIRGSAADPRKPEKDKRGREVAKAALRALAKGESVAITPDGPRGPAERVQPGVAMLAAMAKAPTVAFGVAVRPSIVLPSWDRMPLPLPFGRGAKVYGAPLPPPASREPEALEAHRLAQERDLAAATARADALVGRRPG